MSKILLVDDDAVTVEVYRKKLLQQGFEVNTAGDGLAAVKSLNDTKPDLVVLDLMMPKFNGFEVLKYLRSQEELKNLRVVVLSNFYSNDADQTAMVSQADVSLLKSNCTPVLLVETINHVLGGASVRYEPPLAASGPRSSEGQLDGQAKARREFLKHAPGTLATIRQLNEAFIRSDRRHTQSLRLLDFHQRVHFMTEMAADAGYDAIALLAASFETLLLELHKETTLVTPSALQTIACTLDFFRLLFADAERSRHSTPLPSQVLVVDDDAVSAHAMVTALKKARLSSAPVQDPFAALQSLGTGRYGLILLDVELPGMDGFELCRKIRELDGYQKTPIIFVTGHSEFDDRINSVLSGADDLISKPILPAELGVKTVTHLLRSHLPQPWGSA